MKRHDARIVVDRDDALTLDPLFVVDLLDRAAAARELRDRYLEEFNNGRFLPSTAAKYEVTRALPQPVGRADVCRLVA